MTWNWNPHTWKSSTRLLLAVATIWPIVYIPLFVVLAFSGMLFGVMFAEPAQQHSRRLDLIQLEKKIQDGEIRELRITSDEMHAIDRDGHDFHTSVDNESTREELIRQARAPRPDGSARVSKIDENTSRPVLNPLLPVGFLVLFAVHILTVLLMFLLMPVYIILPLKNERLDQNMRIVWVILACTVSLLSHPVYWYLYVWRKPPATPPATPQFV